MFSVETEILDGRMQIIFNWLHPGPLGITVHCFPFLTVLMWLFLDFFKGLHQAHQDPVEYCLQKKEAKKLTEGKAF